MSEKKHEPAILEHEYDGIKEYDNPTPGWWHALFALTVIFSVFYFTFWHFSPMAWSIEEAYAARQTKEYAKIFGSIGELEGDEATILRMMGDERMLAVARGIFEGNCAACHARDGGGITGVNLTDDHYKNVRSLADIYTVINRGAASGAMPAWQNRLSQNERVILSAYVASLRGTTPASGRGPEGEVIPPWPPVPPAAEGNSASAAR